MVNIGEKVFSGLDAVVYRATGGKVGMVSTVTRAPVLLITTTGRKSGQARTTPLMYLRDGEKYVVTASRGGAPTNPGWLHNLRAKPEATVQVGRDKIDVTAAEVPDEQRDGYWARLDPMYSGFAKYRAKTSRVIPIVVLTPKPPPAG